MNAYADRKGRTEEITMGRESSDNLNVLPGEKADRLLSALRGPLFLKVLNKVSQGIVITDDHRKIILANQAFLETTGSSFASIAGERCSFMQGNETDPDTVRNISKCLKRVEEYNGEILNYRQDTGERFWNELTIAPIIDDEERHIGFIGITRDITERKEAHAELTRRKRMYRVIFENVQAGLVLHGPDGTIKQINPKARELLKVDEEAIGIDHHNEKFWDFVRIDGAKMPVAEYPLSIALQNDGFLTDYVVGIKDRGRGETTWVICNACPEYQEEEINYILVSFTDITALVEKDAQLKSSEERFRIVSKVASDAIWDADLISGEIWRSEGWATITGSSKTQSNSKQQFAYIIDNDRDRVKSSFERALKSNAKNWEDHYFLKGPSGVQLFVRDRAIIIRDDRGNAIRAVGAISDLTRERAQEEALRRSERMSALGSFTGGVAHDFNNLLMIIAGNAELLEDEILRDDALEMVENIKQASKSGADLTGRLLAFARQQPLAADTIFLESLFGSLHEMLRSMIPENIQLSFLNPPDVWPVWCDRSQIENAIINLVLNSQDALMGGGSIEITTRNIEVSTNEDHPSGLAPGDYVVISVCDDGRGIPSNYLPSVLEPFFTTKALGDGTGLGLSMVYGFAKQSGGELEIESAEGHGTLVKLYLPRSSKSEVRRERKRYVDLPRGSEPILIVEDNPQVLAYAEKLLLSLGYQVHTAKDGLEAVELIKGGLIVSVLLTDIIMPRGMSGHELAAVTSELLPGVKVIYMSGYLGTDALDIIHRDPNIPVLRKPYERTELANIIREQFDQ